MNNESTISLAKFASRFLGISGKNLKYLTHEDIKHLFPNVKRSTFSYIQKNPGELECGNIALVEDGRQVIPYYVPKISFDYEANPLNSINHKKTTKQCIDYAGMKIYELKKLLNVRFNGYHTSRYARRELEKRGVELKKKYNRNEFKKWRKDYERN